MKKLPLLLLVLLVAIGLTILALACGEGGGGDDDADDADDDVDGDVDDDIDDDVDDDIDDDSDDDIDDDIDDDVDDDTGEGKAVQFDDPSAEGYVKMYSDLGSQTESFEMEWDWKWVSGEGMSVQLYKQGGTPDWAAAIDFYAIGLKGPHIEAFDKNDNWVVCVASVNYGEWYHFKVTVEPGTKKYSVFVDGNPTSCTDLDLNLALLGKIIGVRVLAYSDVNGGQTILDNLVLTRSGTPFFSDDFEDDAVGNPPGAPWTVDTASGGSALVIQLD